MCVLSLRLLAVFIRGITCQAAGSISLLLLCNPNITVYNHTLP
jgi:hypothetical protein